MSVQDRSGFGGILISVTAEHHPENIWLTCQTLCGQICRWSFDEVSLELGSHHNIDLASHLPLIDDAGISAKSVYTTVSVPDSLESLGLTSHRVSKDLETSQTQTSRSDD